MTFDELVSQSMEELRLKTAAHDRLWQLGEADWSVDQDVGQIVFSAPNGMTTTCSVQIIGTYNTDDSTWLWGWDHPSVQQSLRVHAESLRKFGDEHGIADLTTRKLTTTEDHCWELTALACKLNDAQGAYRGPSGPTLVFMTFGEPSISGEGLEDAGVSASGRTAADESKFSSDVPGDVANAVMAFIKALHDWEVESYAATKADDSPTKWDDAKKSYNELIRKWCVGELEPQSISFSSDPHHDPVREKIVGASVSGGEVRVRTQHTNSMDFVADYEYHLRLEDGRWLIENMFYVDGADKYPSL